MNESIQWNYKNHSALALYCSRSWNSVRTEWFVHILCRTGFVFGYTCIKKQISNCSDTSNTIFVSLSLSLSLNKFAFVLISADYSPFETHASTFLCMCQMWKWLENLINYQNTRMSNVKIFFIKSWQDGNL